MKKVGRGDLKLVGCKKPPPRLICAFPKALGTKIFCSKFLLQRSMGIHNFSVVTDFCKVWYKKKIHIVKFTLGKKNKGSPGTFGPGTQKSAGTCRVRIAVCFGSLRCTDEMLCSTASQKELVPYDVQGSHFPSLLSHEIKSLIGCSSD